MKLHHKTKLIFLLSFILVTAVAYIIFPLVVNAPLTGTLVMWALWVVGFAMFAKAKLSVIRAGTLISLGTQNMSQANRNCYILGYVLMGAGLILSLAFIAFYG